MIFRLSDWDIVLLLAVSIEATLLAYVPQPRWKAVLFSLPIPFTLLTLSTGRSVDATTMLGLALVFLYTQVVRLLHQEHCVPILPSIVIAALGYCAAGTLIARVLPRTALTFWLSAVVTIGGGTLLLLLLPFRVEPEQRTSLPVWIKWPSVLLVLLFLISAKNVLQGFATVFPIMGVFTSYEARRSLWTVGRQGSIIMLTVGSMVMASHLAEPFVGLQLSLLVAWGVWAVVFMTVTRATWLAAARKTSRSGARERATDQ